MSYAAVVPSQPVQQPPAVQRLRIRYAKRGRLRFTSHRDFGRAFERAIRRAGLPIAYSSGFSPHSRISYANASPTGALSEAEYLEIGLVEARDPAVVRARLDQALPAGLDVVEVVESGQARGSLADRLEASVWKISFDEVSLDELESAVAAFLDAERLEVERMTKRGVRVFDCRSAVVRLAVASDDRPGAKCATIDMVMRHGTPSVRPDDVLAGLRLIASFVPPVPPLQKRLAQGPLDPETGRVGDPLEPDRRE
jgi:radical SAM-linked protein